MPSNPFASLPLRLVAATLVLCATTACARSSADAPAGATTSPGAATAAPAAASKPSAGSGTAPVDVRAAIARKLDVPVDAVKPSLVPGLYEVVHAAEVLYATADGKYVLAGDLYDLDTKSNLTEQRRSSARAAALKKVAAGEYIEFGPATAKYTIDVFTDIDCGYCRQLHSEIAEYNRLGIRVRYLFYPRSGPGTESWQKAVSVACAPNPQDALTRAKRGEDVPARSCKTAPVAKTYELGRELQVRGTPGIFTEKGDYVPGYRPPAQMLELLQQLDAEAAAAG
jgi:thiol:disulfide interchange protein DsbC